MKKLLHPENILNPNGFGINFQSAGLKVKKLLFFTLLSIAIIFSLSHDVYALKGNTNSHDPSALIKDGNRYWQFTTGQGIYAAYSYDLISWTAGPHPIFPVGTWPSWIDTAVPGFNGEFWAPDVIYMNGQYHLYYSVSTFGSSKSAIGLVTNPTLDPNSTSYKWTDRGMVVSSDGSTTAYNAIDPALIRDSDGRVYMSYGSFFGGLVVLEIDPATGKVRSGSPTVKLAGGGNSDWEAPYIIKEGNYYYLFANRGKCCLGSSSTYYLEMGRSTSIWGPYYSQSGVNLNNGNGTLVLGSSGKYHGPGHVGLLREGGSNFVSIHYYDLEDNGNAKLDIVNLGFTNGWPFLTRDWIASGQYSVQNKHSGLYMDPWGCTGAQGQAVAQATGYNSSCQRWNFSPLGDGVYRITTPISGRVLDVNACDPNNGAKIQLWDWLNNNCQKFKIERASDGSHVFTSLTGNRVIDVPGKSTTSGTQLALYDYNGGNNQKWTVNWLGTNTTARMLAENQQSVEDKQESSFKIYPNPFIGGKFRLELGAGFEDKVATIIIQDMNGKQVFRTSVSGRDFIELDLQLIPGVYILNLKGGAVTRTSKLVVQ